MKIAITGASGFVGQKLLEKLSDTKHSLIALSRSPIKNLPNNAEWRPCELFSSQSTMEALKGADVVFYLVHSMLPSSRLFQGEFRDTDLLIADNLSRSCKENKVKQIIYLGGVVPEGRISEHLESRMEVEGVLQATGIPVTVFRSGMIVGGGGSSFEILKSLVVNLPVMILPKWTKSQTQAIHIEDVSSVLVDSINNKPYLNKTFDLVNGEKLTYQGLMELTAKGFKLKRYFIPVAIKSAGFSKLWVTFFGKSHYNLVSPLIDSLLCDLPHKEPNPIFSKLIRFKSYLSMVEDNFNLEGLKVQSRPKRKVIHKKSVRSIQRLTKLEHKNSDWIAKEYMTWLTKKFRSLIRVVIQEETGFVEFRFFLIPKPILILQYIAGDFDEDRQKFHIVGGLLSKTKDTGWLEFRQVQNKKYTLTAIHEFVPSLPWYIYVNTQAIVHKKVMESFGRHLNKFR
ncbi:MAG: NAD(P)H-binding protein [Leptospira sp.]|nr:NAD(P)H-binding protein [Leptospira sp.]